MKALRIYAGPKARESIRRQGLQPRDIGVVPAAAGGPKGLILGPLDRFIFGEWLAQYEETGRDYAACRYVETMGAAPVATELEALVRTHDELSGALSDRPLA